MHSENDINFSELKGYIWTLSHNTKQLITKLDFIMNLDFH